MKRNKNILLLLLLNFTVVMGCFIILHKTGDTRQIKEEYEESPEKIQEKKLLREKHFTYDEIYNSHKEWLKDATQQQLDSMKKLPYYLSKIEENGIDTKEQKEFYITGKQVLSLLYHESDKLDFRMDLDALVCFYEDNKEKLEYYDASRTDRIYRKIKEVLD